MAQGFHPGKLSAYPFPEGACFAAVPTGVLAQVNVPPSSALKQLLTIAGIRRAQFFLDRFLAALCHDRVRRALSWSVV